MDSANVYARGWGQAFETYGIAPTSSVITIVRPDLCESCRLSNANQLLLLLLTKITDVAEVCDLNNAARVVDFFKDCLLPVTEQSVS